MNEGGFYSLLKEVEGLLKLIIALSREACNHIYSKEDISHYGAYHIYLLCKHCGIVASAHLCKYGIATALERYMEVVLKFCAGGYPPYHLLLQKIWLYGGDAVTLYALHTLKRLKQIPKRLASCAAKVARIDSGDNYLLYPACGNLLCLLNQICNWNISAFAPCKRYGAI